MKKILLLFVLFISFYGFSQENYQKVRVFFQNQEELKKAVNLAETEPRTMKKGVFF